MRRRSVVRAVVLLLCLASCVAAQEAGRASSSAQPKLPGAFQKATQTGAVTSDVFDFELNGFSYHIAANGNGRRTGGDKTRRFNLQLDRGDHIERIYFSDYDGNLLLACGVTDGESGAGIIVRLEQPSMRSLWRQRVPTFNIGEPLRDGRRLYVTGIGFVGALELKTGEYVWQHEKLYGHGRDNAFNSFVAPELKGEEVLFKELPVYNGTAKTVVVNKKTGKIVRIE
jgi:outer membrane protein assembly factor BamB